jgi:hypothetical protein
MLTVCDTEPIRRIIFQRRRNLPKKRGGEFDNTNYRIRHALIRIPALYRPQPSNQFLFEVSLFQPLRLNLQARTRGFTACFSSKYLVFSCDKFNHTLNIIITFRRFLVFLGAITLSAVKKINHSKVKMVMFGKWEKVFCAII